MQAEGASRRNTRAAYTTYCRLFTGPVRISTLESHSSRENRLASTVTCHHLRSTVPLRLHLPRKPRPSTLPCFSSQSHSAQDVLSQRARKDYSVASVILWSPHSPAHPPRAAAKRGGLEYGQVHHSVHPGLVRHLRWQGHAWLRFGGVCRTLQSSCMEAVQGRGGMCKSWDTLVECLTNRVKMDGIVTSVLRTGFFVDCGSLQAFVGRSVSSILPMRLLIH